MSFDDVAELYDAVRPGYPESLFDDLFRLGEVPPDGRVLEIGAGTGQATEPLARRGVSVVALEPGPRLAAAARRRLASYPNVRLLSESFEAWQGEGLRFDLVASATAFHWVNPDIGYRKAFECLVSGGALGLFWNRHVRGQQSDDFYAAVADLYRRWAPHLAASFNLPEAKDATGDERIEASGLFGPIAVRRYEWEDPYDAGRYTDLLRTYSDHIALSETTRAGLLGDIERLIDETFGGRVTLSRVSVLYVAKRS